MSIRFRFRFRWIPFFATVMVVGVACALGQWQLRRAAEKEALDVRLAAYEVMPPIIWNTPAAVTAAMEYRRVVVRGEWVRDWPVFLDNRPYHGAAGFYVVMPLRIAGLGRDVLVARGWAPRDFSHQRQVPAVVTPSGMVEVHGIVKRNLGHVLQLGQPAAVRPQAMVQNLDFSAWTVASQLPLEPFVLEQFNETPDGLVRDWPRPATGMEKNRGYALQWYGLAVTALIFFIVTGWRRETE